MRGPRGQNGVPVRTARTDHFPLPWKKGMLLELYDKGGGGGERTSKSPTLKPNAKGEQIHYGRGRFSKDFSSWRGQHLGTGRQCEESPAGGYLAEEENLVVGEQRAGTRCGRACRGKVRSTSVERRGVVLVKRKRHQDSRRGEVSSLKMPSKTGPRRIRCGNVRKKRPGFPCWRRWGEGNVSIDSRMFKR